MVFVRAIAGTAKEKGKRMNKGSENDSIVDEEWRTNERDFVVTNVMEDEALSYEKEEEEETTHSVCTRQIMDDANRLKYSKYQQRK